MGNRWDGTRARSGPRIASEIVKKHFDMCTGNTSVGWNTPSYYLLARTKIPLLGLTTCQGSTLVIAQCGCQSQPS